MIDLSPRNLEIVKRVLRDHVPGCEVRAFGSRAKWTAKDYSDLDLALVGESEIGDDTLARLREAFEDSSLPMRVDVLDWHSISPAFREVIERDCVSLATGSSVPSWRQTTLGACASLVGDKVDPAECGDQPYIGLEHIGQGTLSLLGTGTAADVESIKTAFRAGDILFGKLRPYFRKIIRPDFDGICSTDIWVVRPKAGVDTGYLFYLMASKAFVDFASQGSEGTRMPRAKWEHAAGCAVCLPSATEQRTIARILSALDDKIELNRRMNKTLEAMARALFKSWFVSFDPVRAQSRPSSVGVQEEVTRLFPRRCIESAIGAIPDGWRVKTLGDLCDKPQYGYTASAQDSAGSPKFLRITDINKAAWIDWRGVPSCQIDEHDYGKYRLREGDVLIARMADPGHGVLVEEDREAVFASYLIRFRPTNGLYGRYIQYWLRSERYWSLVSERGVGTTRKSLNANALSQFPLVVPPVAVAEAFAARVSVLRKQLVSNVVEANSLLSVRDAILPKLIAGETRVGQAETAVEDIA